MRFLVVEQLDAAIGDWPSVVAWTEELDHFDELFERHSVRGGGGVAFINPPRPCPPTVLPTFAVVDGAADPRLARCVPPHQARRTVVHRGA